MVLKGSIVPVAPGRMRNIWYPANKAQYMTVPQLKEAIRQGIVIEREHTFGMEQTEASELTDEGAEPTVDVQLNRLSVKYTWCHQHITLS